MSERTCVQTVNRFGYPMSDCCPGEEWHGEGPSTFPLSECRAATAYRDICGHHEPLYAEPVADTTAEVGGADPKRGDRYGEPCLKGAGHWQHTNACDEACYLTVYCGHHPFVPPQPAADAHRHGPFWQTDDVWTDAGVLYYRLGCQSCGSELSAFDVLDVLNEHAGGGL